MYTAKELEDLGAQVVAGKVIVGGRFIEGIWTKEGFSPADDKDLPVTVEATEVTDTKVEVAEPAKPAARRAAPKAE